MNATYGAQGLAVVSVSMDERWDVVRKHLAEHLVPYQILLGDDPTAQRYGIRNMPDKFLIDRQGNVAAAYLAGLVDRENIEANIKALPAKP